MQEKRAGSAGAPKRAGAAATGARRPATRPESRQAAGKPVDAARMRGAASSEGKQPKRRTDDRPLRTEDVRRGKRKPGKKRGMGLMDRLLMIGAVIAVLLIVIGIVSFNRPAEDKPVNIVVAQEDLIRSYASQNGLEPAYVAAVIMAESSYDPNAVSSVNAQGLMQILPSTGEWIAHKLDDTYVDGCLFDPETSIRYGCWYLKWLMDRYGGDMSCASSAYHQGHGTVDGWLKDAKVSLDGKTLTNIPSDATKTYVTRILKYYEKYKEIYG